MKQLNNTSKIWLYDIIFPHQYFSSFDWVQCAIYVIKKLIKQNKTPIIVGGTYLYLFHLLYKLETENIGPDWSLRKYLERKSINQLQMILKNKDIKTFKRLNQSDRNNPRRLIRKIEISKLNKDKALLSIKSTPPKQIILNKKLGLNKLNIKFIGLKFKDKERLEKIIERRVKKRLKNGAINEVKKLLKMGYGQNDPGIKTIGCQQIIQYLKGKMTKEEAVKQWTRKEIQYAKRQYTFMKKDKNIKWIYC